MSSSQVMECSKAADRRSRSGAGSTSMRMSPQPDVRYRRTAASAVGPHEMKHCILVDDGRVLHVLHTLVILEIGVRERQLSGAMRLQQHALELDLRQGPVGARAGKRTPNMADVGLAVSDPTVRVRCGVPANFEYEAWKVGPTADDGERRRLGRRYHLPLRRRARDLVADVHHPGKETAKHGTPQSIDIGRLGAKLLGGERGDQAGVGAKIARSEE